jgi:uncharacterized protein YbaR (Trm112 family)
MITYENYNKILICPSCKSKLSYLTDKYKCVDNECELIFPVVNGIPILINEDNSAFRIDDFISFKETTIETKTNLIRIANRFIPSLNLNITAKNNINSFKMETLKVSEQPKILVLGCRAKGHGMKTLYDDNNFMIFNTDVSLGNNT